MKEVAAIVALQFLISVSIVVTMMFLYGAAMMSFFISGLIRKRENSSMRSQFLFGDLNP